MEICTTLNATKTAAAPRRIGAARATARHSQATGSLQQAAEAPVHSHGVRKNKKRFAGMSFKPTCTDRYHHGRSLGCRLQFSLIGLHSASRLKHTPLPFGHNVTACSCHPDSSQPRNRWDIHVASLNDTRELQRTSCSCGRLGHCLPSSSPSPSPQCPSNVSAAESCARGIQWIHSGESV